MVVVADVRINSSNNNNYYPAVHTRFCSVRLTNKRERLSLKTSRTIAYIARASHAVFIHIMLQWKTKTAHTAERQAVTQVTMFSRPMKIRCLVDQ